MRRRTTRVGAYPVEFEPCSVSDWGRRGAVVVAAVAQNGKSR
jgi:hypothetical protein